MKNIRIGIRGKSMGNILPNNIIGLHSSSQSVFLKTINPHISVRALSLFISLIYLLWIYRVYRIGGALLCAIGVFVFSIRLKLRIFRHIFNNSKINQILEYSKFIFSYRWNYLGWTINGTICSHHRQLHNQL